MAQRGTDVVQVVVLAADAHAFLRGGRARVIALLAAEKHVLELVHSGIGEEQGRIVGRHERRTGHDPMAVALEVIQEGGANLVGMHLPILLVGIETLAPQPGEHGGRLKTLRDQLSNEACSGPGVEGGDGRLFEPPGDGAVEQRRLVDLGKHLGDRCRCDLRRNAQLLDVLEDPSAAAPFDAGRHPAQTRARPADRRASGRRRSRSMTDSTSSAGNCRRINRSRSCLTDSSRRPRSVSAVV